MFRNKIFDICRVSGSSTRLNRTMKDQRIGTPAFIKTARSCQFCKSVAVRSFSSSSRILTSPFPDIKLPSSNLTEYIWENVDRWPHKIAMECAVTGKSITYSKLRTMSSKLGASLLKMGLHPRDVVTVILPNMCEFPVAILGTIEAGLIASTINPSYTSHEICQQIKDSESKCVITHPDILPQVLQGLENIKQKILVICTDSLTPGSTQLPTNVISLSQLTGADIDTSVLSSASQRMTPDETVLLPYSSGTTGLPKGVCLTHRSLTANLAQMAHPYSVLVRETTGCDQDVLPGVLPFFHVYGLSLVLLQGLRRGCKIVTLPRFDPEIMLNVLENEKSLVLYIVPPIILFLGSHPSVNEGHLKNIRYIVSGGAPCGSADIERILEKKDIHINQAYGMTEASPMLTICDRNVKNAATIGAPVCNTLAKVVDMTSGKELSAGEVGEICFKGPQVMKCYHNRPTATAETIVDNWLHTGDIGYYDENKYFFIMDRIKELIKVKGFQVAPAELEALLRQHPQISDAAVTGIPCSKRGEKPVAFVVPKLEASSVLDVGNVQNFVAERVVSYKKISEIVVIDKIPKTPSGKILRRELKALAKEKF